MSKYPPIDGSRTSRASNGWARGIPHQSCQQRLGTSQPVSEDGQPLAVEIQQGPAFQEHVGPRLVHQREDVLLAPQHPDEPIGSRGRELGRRCLDHGHERVVVLREPLRVTRKRLPKAHVGIEQVRRVGVDSQMLGGELQRQHGQQDHRQQRDDGKPGYPFQPPAQCRRHQAVPDHLGRISAAWLRNRASRAS